MQREDITRLVSALVSVGYDGKRRAVLLAGIDGRVRGALPEHARPYDQALSDVQELLRFGEVGQEALGALIRSAAEGAVGPAEATLRGMYALVVGRALPVMVQPAQGVAAGGGGVKKILFLGANPLPPPTVKQTRYRQLRIDQELAEVERELALARASVEVKPGFSASFAELQRRLLDVQPQYVHLGCHGEPGKLVLVDAAGQQQAVSWKAVVGVLKSAAQVEGCVIMACDSAPLAEQVATTGRWAVGMREAISDSASLAYSRGFYLALARGVLPADCHHQGCLAVMALGGDEEDVPQFFAAVGEGVDAGRSSVSMGAAVAAQSPSGAALNTPAASMLKCSTLVLSPWPAADLSLLGLPAPQVVVAGPPNGAQGPWQKHHPPGTPAWAEAEAGITAALARCESLTGRLAVLASTSYAMGAWLGLGLANLGVELEYWQAWGPPPQQWIRLGGAMDHGQAVLLASGLKAVAGDRPVALFVGITHAVVPAETEVHAHAQVVLAPAQVKPDALSSVAQAQQAAWDLGQVLATLHGKLQGRHEIHVFYVGPLAVLMMAAGRLRTVNPVVVHERFAVGDQWKFAPAVRFEGGWARRV